MTKEELNWFEDACGVLSVLAEEDNEVAAGEFAKKQKLLQAQLFKAESLETDGKLKAQLDLAENLGKEEKYTEAVEALDLAGEMATQIISSQEKKKPIKEQQPGDLKELLVKEKAKTYENEQFQRDEEGNVMHGGVLRGNSRVRTKYYTDEEKKKSEVGVNEEGRLVNSENQKLTGTMGFAVDGKEGTVHTFDPKHTEFKEGYKLHDHHSSPLQGKGTAAAGEQKVHVGVITEINAQSGHYRPEPEHIHQYVEGLKEQGVQMHQQDLKSFDEFGETQSATYRERKDYAKLKEYEQKRERDGIKGPYEPEFEELRKKLRATGVGPSQKDAKVEVFDKRSSISVTEWEGIKGDIGKIYALFEKKLGKKLEDAVTQFPVTKADDLAHCNDILGRYLRFGEGGEEAGRVSMKSDQFVQTGGNMEAVGVKKKAGNLIMERRIKQLGGLEQLVKLGVQNPEKLSLQEQVEALENASSSSGVVESKGGGLPPGDDKDQPEEGFDQSAFDKYTSSELRNDDKEGYGGPVEELSYTDSEFKVDDKKTIGGLDPSTFEEYAAPEDKEDDGKSEGGFDQSAFNKYTTSEVRGEDEKGKGSDNLSYTDSQFKVDDGKSEGGFDQSAFNKYTTSEVKGEDEKGKGSDDLSYTDSQFKVEEKGSGKPSDDLSYTDSQFKVDDEKSEGGFDQSAFEKYTTSEHKEGEKKKGSEDLSYTDSQFKVDDEKSEGGFDQSAFEKYTTSEHKEGEKKKGSEDLSYTDSQFKKEDKKSEGDLDQSAFEKYTTSNLKEGGYGKQPEGDSYTEDFKVDDKKTKRGSSEPVVEKFEPLEMDDLDEDDKKEEEEPPKPTGPKPVDIRQVKTPTSNKPDPLQGKYDKLGGDSKLLEREMKAWKQRNVGTMKKFQEFEQRRRSAMSTYETTKEPEDKKVLDELAEELKKFKKEADEKDPLPSQTRLAKLPVAERIKKLGN